MPHTYTKGQVVHTRRRKLNYRIVTLHPDGRGELKRLPPSTGPRIIHRHVTVALVPR